MKKDTCIAVCNNPNSHTFLKLCHKPYLSIAFLHVLIWIVIQNNIAYL